MILTCPACATSYFVSDAVIGPSGRRVRCKSCGHDWRVTNDEIPLELDGDVAAAVSPGLTFTEVTEEDAAVEQPLTQAFRARAEQKRRTQKAVRQGLAWGIMIALMLGGFLAAFLWRDSIVERAPKLAAVYGALGIKTNPVGLDFEAVTTGFANNDIGQIYVSGALRNLKDREVVAPPIRIAMIDRSGREYDHHIHRVEAAPVLPGAVQGFAVIVPNTDGRFSEAKLRFATPEEIEASRPAKQAVPATTQQAPSRPEPLPAMPETTETEAPAKASPASFVPDSSETSPNGLRRIVTLTGSTNSAHSALDTGYEERVSARNG